MLISMVNDPTATERKRRQRLREKLEAEEQAVKQGDLNFGMKPSIDCFPSQEEYLTQFPDKTVTDYIKFKIEWNKETRQNEEAILAEDRAELRDTLKLEPLNPKCRATCVTFRNAYLNFGISSADWRIVNHSAVCSFCSKWLVAYTKSVGDSGVNLWQTESKAEDVDVLTRREQGWQLSCGRCGTPLVDGVCPRGCV